VWWLSDTVTATEIADLLRQGADIIERGDSATADERRAYHDRKLAMLERMAHDPGPFTDPDEAAYWTQVARSEVEALRHGARSLLGDL
jgi:hypothetical protein